MAGFNFGQIGNIIGNIMDTDSCDIERNVNNKRKLLYENIPCHAQFMQIDNPNPVELDVKPIIQVLAVHMGLWVDVSNDDYITVYKKDAKGRTLEKYQGRCGFPEVCQARKRVLLNMSTAGGGAMPPIDDKPAELKYKLTVICNDNNGIPISNNTIYEIKADTEYKLTMPVLEGYDCQSLTINGEDSLDLNPLLMIDKDTTAIYVYEMKVDMVYFRYLLNGLYTSDTGELNDGYHLFGKTTIIKADKDAENVYTIESVDKPMLQEDEGKKLSIKAGIIIVAFPARIYLKVTSVVTKANSKVTFTAVEYNASQAERDAYETGWYDQ